MIQDLSDRYYISTLEDRLALLAAQKVDLIIAHPFNDQVRNIRAAAFVDQLSDLLDMRQIWGGNFGFGYRREGDLEFLRRLGPEKDFSVELVESMAEWDGSRVSSSRVRRSLAAGDMEM